MTRPYRAAVAVLLATGVLVHASTPETNASSITLEDFISQSISRDTEFESILLDELRLTYSKDLQLPARDLVLSVRQEYDLFVDGTNGWATSLGLDKLFPTTGTELSGVYTVDPSSSGSGETAGSVGISLSQSIARNAFGRSTRLLEHIVGIETNVVHHQIVEAYEDYLASVISAYHEWNGAYESLKVGQASYQENLKLLDNIRERQKRQIAKPVDVNKITLQVAGRKEALIRQEETYRQRAAVMCRMLRCTDAEGLVPISPKPQILQGADFQTLFSAFSSHSRTFSVLDLLEAKSGLEVDREADDLLPSLDLLVGLELEGEGSGLSDREEFVFAGVKLEWPFPDQRNRAELENARIDLRAAQLEKTNVRYRLFSDLLSLYHELKKEQRLMEVAEERITLAAAIVKDESENYSFGRVTLNDYIQAVNTLDNAQQNRIIRATRYQLLLTEWRRLTDTLVSPKDLERSTAQR